MNLDEIPSGASVVVDANIFVYAGQRLSGQCREFLSRCAQDEVTGVLPAHILAEAMHQFMILEARELGLIKPANPARQLSEKPDFVRALRRYEEHIRDMLGIGLRFESPIREDFVTAMIVAGRFGLLTNDALLIAIGERLRVQYVASADRGLCRATDFVVCAPDDITARNGAPAGTRPV